MIQSRTAEITFGREKILRLVIGLIGEFFATAPLYSAGFIGLLSAQDKMTDSGGKE